MMRQFKIFMSVALSLFFALSQPWGISFANAETRFAFKRGVLCTAFSNDGSRLAVATSNGKTQPVVVSCINIGTNAARVFSTPEMLKNDPKVVIGFLPDSNKLLIGNATEIYVLDTETGEAKNFAKKETLIRLQNDCILTYRTDADMHALRVYTSDDLTLTHEVAVPDLNELDGPRLSTRCDVNLKSNLLCYGVDGDLYVVDLGSNDTRDKISHLQDIHGVTVSPTGNEFAVACSSSLHVYTWPKNQKAQKILNLDKYPIADLLPQKVFGVKFLSSEKLCFAFNPGVAMIWDVPSRTFGDRKQFLGGRSQSQIQLSRGRLNLNSVALELAADQTKIEVIADPSQFSQDYLNGDFRDIPFSASLDAAWFAYPVNGKEILVTENKKPAEFLEVRSRIKLDSKMATTRAMLSVDGKLGAVGSNLHEELRYFFKTEDGTGFDINKLAIDPLKKQYEANINKNDKRSTVPKNIDTADFVFRNYSTMSAPRFVHLDSQNNQLIFHSLWFAGSRTPVHGLKFLDMKSQGRFVPFKDKGNKIYSRKGYSSPVFLNSEGQPSVAIESNNMKARRGSPPDADDIFAGNVSIVIWNLVTQKVDKVLEDSLTQSQVSRGELGEPHSLVVSTNGKYLATDYTKGEILVWNLETGNRVECFTRFTGDTPLSFSGNGRYLCISDRNAPIQIVDLDSGEVINPVTVGENRVERVLAICPTHPRYLSQGKDGILGWRNLMDGKLISNPEPHSTKVTTCCFSLDGTTLLTCSMDKEIRVWNVPPPVPVLDVNEKAVTVQVNDS